MTHSLCKDDDYLKDLYGEYLSKAQKAAIQQDNQQMYYDIEQFKMQSFVNRVLEVYGKKFESFNEVFRKAKHEKKKNQPPLLTNLPLYVKSQSDEEYKSLLIEHVIGEYGPKEPSPVFEEQLKKKLGNFNDFKKPKKLFHDQKLTHAFVENYKWALATQRLFESI